jgi:hypothetical protein
MDQIKHYTGRASAATLGYIAGNIPGAIAADSFYRKIMAPVPKEPKDKGKGKRRASVSSNDLAKRRRLSTASVASSAASSSNVMQKSKKTGGSKVSRSDKSKKKKLSRKFKQQVKDALSEVTPPAYKQERYYFLYKPTDFNQSTFDMGRGYNGTDNATSLGGSGSATQCFFDPVKVLDAASVLFNGKPPAGNKVWNQTGMFDAKNFVVDVSKQWVVMTLKNNSARNMEIKLWTWELKGNAQIDQNFTNEWANAMSNDAAPSGSALNVGNANQNTIGMSPMLSPQMKKLFKIEEKSVFLEPGKIFKHTVQGPSKVYDYAKFWLNGTFNNFQKGTKGVCMALSTDITALSTGLNAVQRYTDIVSVDPFGICVETQYHYVLRLPDQTGFRLQIPTVGTTIDQQLTRRRGSQYSFTNYNAVTQTGTVATTSDENPQATTTQGV